MRKGVKEIIKFIKIKKPFVLYIKMAIQMYKYV